MVYLPYNIFSKMFFCIYLGNMVEKKSGIIVKEVETYRFKDITCEHKLPIMELHLMHSPLFYMYELSFEKEYDIVSIETSKKQKKYTLNDEFRNDYFVTAKVRIKKYSEITIFNDWHVNKPKEKRCKSIL